MKHIYSIIISVLCVACSHYPTPYPNGKGGVAYTTQIGGKWMHTINADGSMAFTGDNEISLQHVVQGLVTLGTYGLNTLLQLEQELTKQLAAAGLNEVEKARIASNLAIVKEGIRQSITSEGIKAGAPLGTISF